MSFILYLKSKLTLIVCLIVASGVMTFLVCDRCAESLYWYLSVFAFTSSIWISMWLGNEYLSKYLDTKISWMMQPGKRFMAGMAAMLIYTVAALYALMQFFGAVLDFKFGALVEMVYGTLIVTFVISLFMTSRSFLANWRQAAIDTEKLQKESMAAKYESLKNQVNPHFLFNSLNALTHLVYEDPDKAAKFIKQLSEVYRYVLDSRDKEVVSLNEELKFLDSYLFLQQIRFGNKLKVNVNLNGVKSSVAPLALQMLIENAIKHNVISEEHPLNIDMYLEKAFIVVENNLQKKSSLDEGSPGLGLENIRQRYEFLSKEKVEIKDREGKFIVKLPILSLSE